MIPQVFGKNKNRQAALELIRMILFVLEKKIGVRRVSPLVCFSRGYILLLVLKDYKVKERQGLGGARCQKT